MAIRNKEKYLKKLSEKTNFKIGNMRGAWTDTLPVNEWKMSEHQKALLKETTDDGPIYVVYSYTTIIGWWQEGSGWTFLEKDYSHTTTIHQNLLRLAQ